VGFRALIRSSVRKKTGIGAVVTYARCGRVNQKSVCGAKMPAGEPGGERRLGGLCHQKMP
jgi:hypothetical protein